jgi:hypothetical protein
MSYCDSMDTYFKQGSLIFIPCIIRRIRRDQQYALIVSLLYSTYWLLHVSAVACHHQGAYQILLSYLKYKSDGRHITRGHMNCVPDCRGSVCCLPTAYTASHFQHHYLNMVTERVIICFVTCNVSNKNSPHTQNGIEAIAADLGHAERCQSVEGGGQYFSPSRYCGLVGGPHV